MADTSLQTILARAQRLCGEQNPNDSSAQPQRNLLLRRLRLAGFIPDTNTDEHLNATIPEASLPFHFARACLVVLQSLHTHLITTSQHTALGVRDLRLVHFLLETVVAWGILPQLSPGVGVPLARRIRSGYSTALTKGLDIDPLSAANQPLSVPHGKPPSAALFSVLSVLLNWLFPSDDSERYSSTTSMPKRCTGGLCEILCTRYLSDLYASLAQISFGPTQTSSPQSPVAPTISSNDSPASIINKVRQFAVNNVNSGLNILPVENNDNEAEPIKVEDPIQRLFSDPSFEPIVRYECTCTGPKEKESAAYWLDVLFKITDPILTLEALTSLMSVASTPEPGGKSLPAGSSWMRACCGHLLSQVTLRPNGVRTVLEFMVSERPSDGEATNGITLAQLERISILLLSVPKQASSVEDYFKLLCAQLLEVVRSEGTGVRKDGKNVEGNFNNILRATTFVLSRLILRRPRLARTLVIKEIAGPFWDWSGPIPSEQQSPRVSPEKFAIHTTEEALDSSLLALSRLLLTTDRASELVSALVRHAVPALYRLRTYARRTGSRVSRLAEEILAAYFAVAPRGEACEALWRAAGLRTRGVWVWNGSSGVATKWQLRFSRGPTGGCEIRWHSAEGPEKNLVGTDVDETTEEEEIADPDTMVAFMKDVIRGPDVSGDFFVRLLAEYVQSSTPLTATSPSGVAGLASPAEYTPDHSDVSSLNPRRLLSLLNLILTMTQTLGPTILHRPTQILNVSSSILENYQTQDQREANKRFEKQKRTQEQIEERIRKGGVERVIGGIVHEKDDISDDGSKLEEQDEEDEEMMEDETVALAMSLVAAMVDENRDLSSQDIHLLDNIYIQLSRFVDHPSPYIRQTAADVRSAVATLNATLMAKSRNSSGTSEAELALAKGWEKYREATRMLSDELLPVRAHGLATLRELVLAKSPVLEQVVQIGGEGSRKVKVLDGILDVFIDMIQDEDSFIYLNSVKCLSALTDMQGEKIISQLGTMYSGKGLIGKQLDPRLRIGEVLLQTVKRCGTALGKYVNVLLPPLYAVLIDQIDSRHMRASALSVLAVACETCPHALGRWHHDIVEYVCDLLILDRSEGEEGKSVRRAATIVLVLLLRGLGRDALYAFPVDMLRKSYRALRNVENLDCDELTRYQARVGLEELGDLVKGEIFQS